MVKQTKVASTIFQSGGKDKVAAADIYSDGSKAVITGFKSKVDEISGNIGEAIKGRRLDATSFSDLIRIEDGVKIDERVLTRRLEEFSGVRVGGDPGELFHKIKGPITDQMTQLTGIEADRVVDVAGRIYELRGSANDARGLFGVLNEMTNGILPELIDTPAAIALMGNLLQVAIDLGVPDAIDAIMEKVQNEDDRKQLLIENMERSARAGDVDTLLKIRGYIGPETMYARCRDLVPLVMQAFRFPNVQDVPPDHLGWFNKFNDLFDSVQPNWWQSARPGITTLGPFNTASPDVLAIFQLCHDAAHDFRVLAMIGPSYEQTDLRQLAKKHWKELPL